jgi:transcriptional regulator with XRE-family HTH domain
MDVKTMVGKNVRAFRNHMGIGQEEFASIAGLNRSWLAGVERGEVNVTVESLERIATVIGVPVNVLLIEGADKWSQVSRHK